MDFPVDFVMASIVGSAGLLPILKAAKKGYTIGLANKESLVCSGSILKEVVRKNNSNILPIDSEHNAIFQVFENENKSEIEKITNNKTAIEKYNTHIQGLQHEIDKLKNILK